LQTKRQHPAAPDVFADEDTAETLRRDAEYVLHPDLPRGIREFSEVHEGPPGSLIIRAGKRIIKAALSTRVSRFMVANQAGASVPVTVSDAWVVSRFERGGPLPEGGQAGAVVPARRSFLQPS
jgi:hypothetical protein